MTKRQREIKAPHVKGATKLRALLFLAFIIAVSASMYPLRNTPPPQDAIITLHRTMCFGTCPVYRITIYGTGEVVYQGYYFVRVKGPRTAYISQGQVRALVEEFAELDFFDLEDSYIVPATDLPSTILSLSVDGRSKTVDVYGGGAPPEFYDLVKAIEDAVTVHRWAGD